MSYIKSPFLLLVILLVGCTDVKIPDDIAATYSNFGSVGCVEEYGRGDVYSFVILVNDSDDRIRAWYSETDHKQYHPRIGQMWEITPDTDGLYLLKRRHDLETER